MPGQRGQLGEREQLGLSVARTAGVEELVEDTAFGRELFSLGGWVLPFEIASLILLVALVAAVWWSREDGE